MSQPRRRWVTARMVPWLIACELTGSALAQGPPATPVRVDAAQIESITRTYAVTGDVQARRQSIVASEEEGLIRVVNVDVGDSVSEGDILAEIDSDLLRIELESANAALAEARATVVEREVEVEQDQRDLDSLLELARTNAVGPKEVNDARSEVALSNARLTRARHAVALAQAEIRRIERKLRADVIRAPFDGVVVVKHVELGQWLATGGPVVELIGTGFVDAVINVPERFINYIELDQRIQVSIRALDEPVTGRVRAIVPLADQQARTYPVKIELDDQDGDIKPGMSLIAWAPTGEIADAVTISKDAIMRSPTGAYLYLVRDGIAVRTSIETRDSAGANRVVIAPGGLAAGDLVVVEGNERLYPGAPVAPTNLDEIAGEADSEAGGEPEQGG